MSPDRLFSATEAAEVLGVPEQARTFIRRAHESLGRGDPRVQQVGRILCAPLDYWREITKRRAGRPRGTKNRTHGGRMPPGMIEPKSAAPGWSDYLSQR